MRRRNKLHKLRNAEKNCLTHVFNGIHGLVEHCHFCFSLGSFSRKLNFVNFCRFLFSRYAGMAVDSVAVEVNQQALAVYSGNFGLEPRDDTKSRQQKQASNSIK